MTRETSKRTGTRVRLDEIVIGTRRRFTFMQRSDWREYHVLQAGEILENLPSREHPAITSLLDQPGIPPHKAVGIIENLRNFSAEQRRQIYTQAASADPYERGNALARAAALPPMPDPALEHLGEARDRLRRAAKVCRLREFAPRMEALRVAVVELRNELVRAGGAHPDAVEPIGGPEQRGKRG